MPASTHRDYSGLAVSGPGHSGRMFPTPRPGRGNCSPTYSGRTVTLEVEVVAADRTHVCIRQQDEAWGEWLAWVPRGE